MMHMSVPPMSVSGELGERMIELLPRLRRLAQAMVGPAGHDADLARINAADDVVEACIASALQAELPWDDQRAFENRMFALLARACTSCLRAPADRSRGMQPGQPSNMAARNSTLRSTYAALPLPQRAAIALVVLEQRSYGDAAAMLEMPLAVLTQQLWQGRQALLQAQLPQA
jgi:RNA polymerase sigma-70 factor, ECF subfamily